MQVRLKPQCHAYGSGGEPFPGPLLSPYVPRVKILVPAFRFLLGAPVLFPAQVVASVIIDLDGHIERTVLVHIDTLSIVFTSSKCYTYLH